jgi:single-stranded DNA-specific DHH superfamily exonuclease
MMGACIGLIGAGLAALFKKFHMRVMDELKERDLLNESNAPKRALLGATVVVTLGMIIPQTMFWGKMKRSNIDSCMNDY